MPSASPDAGLAPKPLPYWLTALSKENPPRPADLTAAYRRTIEHWRWQALWRLVFALQFLFSVVFDDQPGTFGKVLLAYGAVFFAALYADRRVVRRGLWLGAAVSLLGLHGEPALRWLAGLREVRVHRRFLRCTAMLVTAWFVVWFASLDYRSSKPGLWIGLGIAYLITLVVLLFMSIARENRAYYAVRAYLAHLADAGPDPREIGHPYTASVADNGPGATAAGEPPALRSA